MKLKQSRSIYRFLAFVIFMLSVVSVSAESAGAHAAQGPAPWSQADAFYSAEDMASARHHVLAHHGSRPDYLVMFDRFEYQTSDDTDALLFDLQAWYGGDLNKFWFKSEGEYAFTEDAVEEADIQLLWSRAISSYFDTQIGVRYSFKPEGKTHAVLGIQGLAPYRFETDTALYFSEDGDLTANLEAEYEVLITQRLILQPRVEMGLSAQEISEDNLGSGFTDVAIGLRLRYEFLREFAPYLGIEWQSKLGSTRNIYQAQQAETDKVIFMLGLRMWL